MAIYYNSFTTEIITVLRTGETRSSDNDSDTVSFFFWSSKQKYIRPTQAAATYNFVSNYNLFVYYIIQPTVVIILYWYSNIRHVRQINNVI